MVRFVSGNLSVNGMRYLVSYVLYRLPYGGCYAQRDLYSEKTATYSKPIYHKVVQREKFPSHAPEGCIFAALLVAMQQLRPR